MKIVSSLILLIVFQFTTCVLTAQRIDIYGGYMRNTFNDRKKDVGHYNADYKSGPGFVLGMGLDSVVLDEVRFRFFIQLEQYQGGAMEESGSLGGQNKTDARIRRTNLAFAICPLNFTADKILDISVGMMGSVLLAEQVSGARGGWSAGQPFTSYSHSLSDLPIRFNTKSALGFIGRFTLRAPLLRFVYIIPHYQLYYGLGVESTMMGYKSIRHSVALGIQRSHIRRKKK
jgi:hypothetical protein